LGPDNWKRGETFEFPRGEGGKKGKGGGESPLTIRLAPLPRITGTRRKGRVLGGGKRAALWEKKSFPDLLHDTRSQQKETRVNQERCVSEKKGEGNTTPVFP